MTELLKTAIAAITRLPEAEQDAIALRMLALAEDMESPEAIPAEDLDDILAGLEEARRGEFASEEEARAVMARFGA